jgi:hypothetical protein
VRPFLLPRNCTACGAGGYGPEARFCQMCGSALPQPGPVAGENAQAQVPPLR